MHQYYQIKGQIKADVWIPVFSIKFDSVEKAKEFWDHNKQFVSKTQAQTYQQFGIIKTITTNKLMQDLPFSGH